MKSNPAIQSQTIYWKPEGIEGVECFRTCKLRHQYSRHSHDAYAIGVIESGVGVNEYSNGTCYFPAGDIVVMNPDMAHTGSSLGGKPLSYRMFYIDCQTFEYILPDQRVQPYFPDPSIHDNLWAGKLKYLHKLFEDRSTSLLEKQTKFVEILSSFAAKFSKPGVSHEIGKESRAVRIIKQLLEEHYQEDVSIDDLVAITGLNRHYLIRAFKKAVGIPPHAYLNQIRVRHSKELLRSGKPIADTAADLGFADQSHFTRHFKRITGVTPNKYLKGHFRTII